MATEFSVYRVTGENGDICCFPEGMTESLEEARELAKNNYLKYYQHKICIPCHPSMNADNNYTHVGGMHDCQGHLETGQFGGYLIVESFEIYRMIR